MSDYIDTVFVRTYKCKDCGSFHNGPCFKAKERRDEVHSLLKSLERSATSAPRDISKRH